MYAGYIPDGTGHKSVGMPALLMASATLSASLPGASTSAPEARGAGPPHAECPRPLGPHSAEPSVVYA
jgi:hypothetical protein